jgi:hypothetical protein
MNIAFELKGQVEMARALRALGEKGPKAMGAALWKEGNNIMNAAKEITPVDTGALKTSGLVNLPVINGDSVEVTLGFSTRKRATTTRRRRSTSF